MRNKEKGIKAFSNGKLDNAIKHFINSLRQNKNDPETLIYLNNAVAYHPGSDYSESLKEEFRKLSPNIGVLVQVQPNPKGNSGYQFALLE